MINRLFKRIARITTGDVDERVGARHAVPLDAKETSWRRR
jgi:hypothetical protein